MASALIFPGEDALLAALSSDLLPADVQGKPVRYRRDDDGSILVCPEQSVGAKVTNRLRGAGVKTRRRVDASALRPARFWPALIAPRPIDAEEHDERTVLFVLESRRARDRGDDDAARSLLDLVAELLRLGCDRCAYQLLLGTLAAAPGSTDPAGGEPEDQEIVPAEERAASLALLRAFEPPYYTVAAAVGRDAPYRAFIPVARGSSRTWIELGHSHPIAGTIDPPAGKSTLITRDGQWLDVPDGPWLDMFTLVEITAPDDPRTMVAVKPDRTLQVPLALSPATRAEAPSLWVLHGAGDDDDSASAGTSARSSGRPPARSPAGPIDRVDSLVRTLPDDIIARLHFAVLERPGHRDGPVVLLRARHSRSGPPAIDIDGIAMIPFMGIANLYVPHDAGIEPPLRRDMLRELLAPENDRLYWLAPTRRSDASEPPDSDQDDRLSHHRAPVADGRPSMRPFRVESAPDRAFSPLPSWVEYLVHKNADALAPWVRSVTFEFESFQTIGTEWAAGSEARRAERGPRKARRRGREPAHPDLVRDEGQRVVRQRQDTPLPAEIVVPRPALTEQPVAQQSPNEAEIALAELERTFLDSDAPADDPSRTEMWLAMARLLGRLERHRDASLCFVRALWELPDTAAGAVASEWWSAEGQAVVATTELGIEPSRLAWLPLSHPEETGNDALRAAAVHWIAIWLAGAEVAEPIMASGEVVAEGRAVHAVQQWMDRHDRNLDVRTSWLLRCALAARVGGDPLGLARARDRILQRLRGGMSLERDVPTFLRFLRGRSGTEVGDSVAVAQLVDRVEGLLSFYDETPQRDADTLRAPPFLTRAYVHLMVAYGLARLGRSERAHEVRDAALGNLELSDPIHHFLSRAYSARIAQALEGMHPEAPLPPEVTAELEAMGAMDRYKIDRLRQLSTVLEPQQRVDSIDTFLRTRSGEQTDPRGVEFEPLGGITDSTEMAQALGTILSQALRRNTGPEDRARLFDGIMDFLPMMADSQALPMLRSIIDSAPTLPLSLRALVLEEALMLAGFFGRDGIADELARTISEIVDQLPAQEALTLAPQFGACLRNLRRVGLRDRAARLIDVLSAKLTGDDVAALTARVHLASGWAYLGDVDRAQPVLERAHKVLSELDCRLAGVLQLIQALAAGWGLCPQELAFQGLGELASLLSEISDMFATNSHFSLSVVIFMEALVLGYARSELALGKLGRRWLDEDEYLVHRRIRRDFGATS